MYLHARLKYHASILDGITDARNRGSCPQASWTMLEQGILKLELDDLERVTLEDARQRTCKFFNL